MNANYWGWHRTSPKGNSLRIPALPHKKRTRLPLSPTGTVVTEGISSRFFELSFSGSGKREAPKEKRREPTLREEYQTQ